MEDLKKLLEECSKITDKFERRIAVASVITEAFVRNALDYPIVVGGSAVEVYTEGSYATSDIDFISTAGGKEYEVTESLGFIRMGKNLYHNSTDSLTEFPTGPLAGSYERIVKVESEETGLPVYLIGLEDLILDRLESHFATNDTKSKEWAQRLMLVSYDILDFSYLQREAYSRGIGEKTVRFQRSIKGLRKEFEQFISEQASGKESGLYLKFF